MTRFLDTKALAESLRSKRGKRGCHAESCVEEARQAWLDRIPETLRNGISGGIGPEGGKSLIDDLYGLLSYR
jgi:hypothetical protein